LHDRGLVHRDVKPGNIIFVDGRAKLADVGLVSTESEGRTFVGTEGYIPPEGPSSPAADLYALGMVLYECSTGYAPEQFPKVPPEWFAEEAGPESLEFHEVVLRACEGAKERRYQSAEEMQADLAVLQSGRSVRHVRALERRVRRWRRIGGAAAISVALAVATSLAANWRARVAAEDRAKEAQLREAAQKSLARAESAERESRQQLYTALLEQARATVRSGELGQPFQTPLSCGAKSWRRWHCPICGSSGNGRKQLTSRSASWTPNLSASRWAPDGGPSRFGRHRTTDCWPLCLPART
jgi:serine/threonine protein kinase